MLSYLLRERDSLNPEPASYDSSALTATLPIVVAKLWESVILTIAWQNHDVPIWLNMQSGFWKFFLKDWIRLSSHYLNLINIATVYWPIFLSERKVLNTSRKNNFDLTKGQARSTKYHADFLKGLSNRQL